MANYPDVQARAQAEVDTVLKNELRLLEKDLSRTTLGRCSVVSSFGFAYRWRTTEGTTIEGQYPRAQRKSQMLL